MEPHIREGALEEPQSQKKMKMVPYKIVKAPNGDAWVETKMARSTPQARLVHLY
jgi:hypothetical protein